ncbi:hypothetical protein [Hamadaea tsunoensis]|uniref:hypothetical protein n=1 Tax=Hamadaea tsunoensis TaxID=53368 RepID=UPI0003FC3024|nr:hypothetical protein [Hamadaea tsunoensis]
MDWNVVSSVSSAAATVLALGGLALSVALYLRQQNEARAAEIRQDVRGFVDAAHHLIRLLLDGSPMIAASWQSASLLRASLPDGATVRDARALARTQGMGLSLAVVGWGESDQARALEEATARMATASRRLSGELAVLGESGELLRLIAQDLTATSIRLLDGDMLTMVLDAAGQQATDDEDLPRFIASFASVLHGNAAGYFQARYADSVQALSSLVALVGVAVAQLPARDLLAITRPGTPDGGTRTATMRAALGRMGRRLPATTVAEAGRLIDTVESTISPR